MVRVIMNNPLAIFSAMIFSLMINIDAIAQDSDVVCLPEAINIQEGDVVSADVLNEIFNRINRLQTGGIITSDLTGKWQCTSTLRPGGASGTANGYTQNTLGLFTMTQEVEITEHSDFKVRLKYPHNFGQGFQETNAQDCLAHIVNGKIVVTNALTDTGDYEGTCYNTGFYDIQMLGNQCFRMENINESISNCKKINLPPASPTELSGEITSNSNNTSISLVWKAGDAFHESYEVYRKITVEGEYLSIGIPSTEYLLDNNIATGNTYWYRVFAKDTYGVSIGSNVISVTIQ